MIWSLHSCLIIKKRYLPKTQIQTERLIFMGTWKENLNRNGIRKISIDLTPVRELANSFIEWEGETPDNTSIKIETSIDGGNTWDECTNEEAIPNLPDNLEDVTLEVKQKLETKNSNETPILKYLKIKINTIKYVLHEGSGIGNGEHDSRVFYVWKVKHKGEGV
ncbi:MAG: hypothetical protein ACOC1X_00555, partial [Promethearchaeota archaeon]